MLSVVLLILKIIGIILLSVIGLILLLCLFLLLVPLKYQINGEVHNNLESIKASADAKWLLGMAKGDICYEGAEIAWKANFLWWKISSEDEEEAEVQEVPVEKPKVQEVKKEELKKVQEVPTEKSTTQKVSEEKKTTTKKQHKKQQKKRRESSKNQKKTKDKFNLTRTIREFCDKIKEIIKKKEKVMEFFYDSGNQHTIQKLKVECVYLWRYLKPRIFKIIGKIGFEDPATTGKVLGVLGVLYSIYGNNIEVEPNFEEPIYDGEVYIAGKTRLCFFAKTAVVLLLDKQVMRSINNIKKFQSKEDV